ALGDIARTLGADVPMCLHARSGYAAGLGDVFASLAIAPLHVVLINPLKPLSTGAVYAEFDRMGLGSELTDDPPPASHELVPFIQALGNDLAAPAFRLMPELADLAREIAATRRVRHVGLSGSGATLFAIPDDAQGLAAELKQRFPHCWISAARLG